MLSPVLQFWSGIPSLRQGRVVREQVDGVGTIARGCHLQSITVKTFASVSQLLGFAKADVACDGPLPLRVVLAELRSRYPLFSKYLSQVGDEVNLVISCAGRELQLDSLVQPGDELLLLTPIAGG